MRRTSIILVIVTIFASAVMVFAQKGITKRVQFARGSNSATLKGAVIRATKDRYILGAREGQTMTVSVTALEDNAVFYIVGPNGSALEGADDESDITNWTGELPDSGNYSIYVSPTRGNATYTLKVSIR